MITIKNELKAILDKETKINLAKKLNAGFKKLLRPDRFKVLTKIIDGHIAIGIKCISGNRSDLINIWDDISKWLKNQGFINGDDYNIDMKENTLAIDFYPFIEQ